MGCYADPFTTPAGPTHVLNHSMALPVGTQLSLERCVSLCCASGFGVGSIIALKNGSSCFCDNDTGPYPLVKSTSCSLTCPTVIGTDDSHPCGGPDAVSLYGVTSCAFLPAPALPNLVNFAPAPPPHLQACGVTGCTRCPAADQCCIGKSPDSYKVPGGYGCAPPNSSHTQGCAGGGLFPGGCCCAPGPALIRSNGSNVLIIGDSVSAGYTPFVRAALASDAVNVQHGPDNAGGGNADGVGYGELCTRYFVRTPQYELPPWDVITFSFGLHDGADSNASFTDGLSSIADQLLQTAKDAATPGRRPARLVYFQTTIPGGAGSVPGSESPNDKRAQRLNAIAAEIMGARGITIIDLYRTMLECGDACKTCKPHCGPEGYQYLTDHAIVPAIKAALDAPTQLEHPLRGREEEFRGAYSITQQAHARPPLLSSRSDVAFPWLRGSAVRVTVEHEFNYSATLPGGGTCALVDGGLSFTCGGSNYSSWLPGSLRLSGVRQTSGVSVLGRFDSVVALWSPVVQQERGLDCSVRTEIRFFESVDAFVFLANFSDEHAVVGVNASQLPTAGSATPSMTPPLSTAFPVWLPSPRTHSACPFVSYQGNSLNQNFRHGLINAWEGGLEGGPLLLYDGSKAGAAHPPAMVASLLNHPKSLVGGSVSGGRLGFGVHGYIEELPPSFSQQVLLVGRAGIAASQLAWGEVVRRHAGTTRLQLADDILNRKISYWTDNGAFYCYCNRWRSNKMRGHPDQRWVVPMHQTIRDLQRYHRALGLQIEMYHLDSGFWHSAHTDGHCDGVTASNWSASEYHWPHSAGGAVGDGLGPRVWGVPGEPNSTSWQMLYMLLAGSRFVAARPGNETALGNVYGEAHGPMGGPWPMRDDTYASQTTSQVASDHSHAFWDAVLGYGYRQNNLRAIVIDTLQIWWQAYVERLNNTHRQETWLDGYLGPSGGKGVGGASKYGMPVRIDQALPSDHLASALLNWPAVVAARIGHDADSENTWSQMASTGAFLAACMLQQFNPRLLGAEPMVRGEPFIPAYVSIRWQCTCVQSWTCYGPRQ